MVGRQGAVSIHLQESGGVHPGESVLGVPGSWELVGTDAAMYETLRAASPTTPRG